MIYVLAELGDEAGPVKIGHCGEDTEAALRHRVRDAQLGNWRTLVVIARTDGDWSREQSLHAEFAAWRISRGEWFERGGQVQLFIDAHQCQHIACSNLREQGSYKRCEECRTRGRACPACQAHVEVDAAANRKWNMAKAREARGRLERARKRQETKEAAAAKRAADKLVSTPWRRAR